VEVVVGLDCGTTSTKAVTAGDDGRVRDVAGAGYSLLVPAPGRAELDPHRLQQAALEALTEVTALARARGDRIVAVTLCAAMHGLVPLDADGPRAGPLITWADGRASAQAAALRADGRARSLHARTGTPVHPMSPLTKLAWLGEHEPEQLHAAPRWGGVKELLVAALCDAGHVVDVSCASATGLLDLRTGRWDEEALEVAGVRADQLPEVLSATHVERLRDDVAQLTGLPAGTPVVLGAADGALANLGVGAMRPGVAAVSIGTSAALRTVVRSPQVDDAGALFCYALTATVGCSAVR
jgi:gluconokinase